jgi:hypothetical protein
MPVTFTVRQVCWASRGSVSVSPRYSAPCGNWFSNDVTVLRLSLLVSFQAVTRSKNCRYVGIILVKGTVMTTSLYVTILENNVDSDILFVKRNQVFTFCADHRRLFSLQKWPFLSYGQSQA